MPKTPRRDPPPPRRSRAEAEAAIAQAEEQLARYLGHLERRRADGLDTTSAELLVRVIERQLAMASWGRLRPSKEGDIVAKMLCRYFPNCFSIRDLYFSGLRPPNTLDRYLRNLFQT